MKKVTFIIISLSLSYVIFGQAGMQRKDSLRSEKKHIVMASASPLSFTLITHNSFKSYGYFQYDRFQTHNGQFGVKAVAYKPYVSPSFSLTYGQYINSRTLLKINISHVQIKRNWDLYTDDNSPHFYTERVHFLQVMPEIRYDFFKNDYLKLFTAASLGVSYTFQQKPAYSDLIARHDPTFGMSYQLWLFGGEVAFTEHVLMRWNVLGYGTIGLTELGIGCRF